MSFIILGTIDEQEKFLSVILYNEKDKISNVYIETFLKSDIKNQSYLIKFYKKYLENKKINQQKENDIWKKNQKNS